MHCARCHRELKDSVSVARGFGPVCWGKVVNSDQMSLFEMAALDSDYAYRIDTNGGEPVLVIIDLNLGRKSVTNNAEAILEKIEKDEGATYNTVIYKDSQGIFDRIRLINGKAHYSPIEPNRVITDEFSALQAVRERLANDV